MKTSIVNLMFGLFIMAIGLMIVANIETHTYDNSQPHMRYIGRHGFKYVYNIKQNERHDWNNSEVIQITKKKIFIGNRHFSIIKDSGTELSDGEIFYQVVNGAGRKLQVTMQPASDSTLSTITFTSLESRSNMSQIFTN